MANLDGRRLRLADDAWKGSTRLMGILQGEVKDLYWAGFTAEAEAAPPEKKAEMRAQLEKEFAKEWRHASRRKGRGANE